jgi:outer membrane protein TolC
VFVFSSLLTQRQFAESNFALGPLNRPDFLNNFQSLVSVDQTVYDWGGTTAQVRSAELGREISKETQRLTEIDLVARVVQSYYAAVLARASLDTARAAMKSAEADASRAENVRKAGMSTDADVLSIRVHLAAIREVEIRRGYDVQVAMAALNEALGLPLETQHQLVTPLTPANPNADVAVRFETAAAENRPELKQAALNADAAQQRRTAARSGLFPRIELRGVFEADRQRFVNRGGANWLVNASLRWNLFDGKATRARIGEAEATIDAARAQQRQASAAVRLQVQRAWADYRSANERIAVTSAAVAQAEESLRITKNRYEAGLSTVTDLLRTETALLDTQTRRLAAIHDQRIAAAMLERAAGTLSVDSEVLK